MAKWLKSAVISGSMALATAGIGPVQATTLADALVQAYTTNPQLSLQQSVVRIADEDVINQRGDLLPTLTQTGRASQTKDLGNTRTARSIGTTLSFTTRLGIQLYDGGADRLDIESAKMSLLAARQQLKEVEQTILLNTVSAYMNVRRDQAFVRLARNNVRVLREQVRAANDRFDVGEVTRTDVSQAKARLASALSSLEASKGNLMRSADSYVAVVGTRPNNLRTPPPAPKIPATASKAEAVAIHKHPRIIAAQFQAKAAEIAMQSAAKGHYPQVDASVSHTIGDTRRTGTGYTNNSVTADITGQITLYAGDKLNSAKRRAQAAFERSQSNLQLQGYITRQSLRNAFTGWQVARASIVAGRQQVRAAQIAFEGVREEAKLGARTTLDTLDAEQELLSARSNLVASIRDEYVATYAVLAEMGLLTAQHLKLGVPIYNPDVNYTKVTKKQANPLGLKRLKIFDKLKKRRGN